MSSAVTDIGAGAFNNCAKLTLYVESGSAAEKYAKDNTVSYKVIENDTTDRNITGISVQTPPSKTSYNYKESLDTRGLTLRVDYSDSTYEIVSSGYEVESQTFNKTGSYSIDVDYQGFSTTFRVSVSYAWWQWIIRIILLGFLWY